MTLLFSAKNVLKADSDDATSDDVIVAVMSFFHPPASSSSLLSFFSLLLRRCFRSAASVGNFTSSAERTRNQRHVKSSSVFLDETFHSQQKSFK